MIFLRLTHNSLKIVSIMMILFSSLCLLTLFSMMLNQEFDLSYIAPLTFLLLCFACSILAITRSNWYVFLEGGFVILGVLWIFSEMRGMLDELNAIDEIEPANVLDPEVIETIYVMCGFLFSSIGAVSLIGMVGSVCTLRYLIARNVE